MEKLEIVKVFPQDFDRVYPLLCEPGLTFIPKENWKRLFMPYWSHQEDFVGYGVLVDGIFVSFVGFVFSRRNIEDKNLKICNLSSLVTAEEHRRKGYGVKLVSKIRQMDDYVITAYSHTNISGKLGKREIDLENLETHLRVIYPLILNKENRADHVSITYDDVLIRNFLSGDDRTIFEDHLELNGIHCLIRVEDKELYLILRKNMIGASPIAEIHYISHVDKFFQLLNLIRSQLCESLNVRGLQIDERWVKGRIIEGSRSVERRIPKLIRIPPGRLSKQDFLFDTLYSEVFLLDFLEPSA